MRNIFDYNVDGLNDLISKFVKNIKEYKFKKPEDYNYFPKFFFDQLDKAISMKEEKEEIPKWVVDFEDFRMKTEIVICSKLFDAFMSKVKPNIFSGPEMPLNQEQQDMAENLRKQLGLPEFDENEEIESEQSSYGGAPSPMIQSIVGELYIKCQKYGIKRDWDVQILHFQLLRLLGHQISESTLDHTIFKINEGIDYN